MRRQAALVIAAAMLWAGNAVAQTATVAGATGGSMTGGVNLFGQSFTAGARYNNITFTFLNASGASNSAQTGNLYLFSSAYTGTPAGLAASTSAANYVGIAGVSNGAFTFAPGITLTGGSQYFAYTDTQFTTYGATNTYAGGNYLLASNTTSAYNNTATTFDINFRVNGVLAPLAPEPGSWALIILGFGVAGAALRRRPIRARAPLAA